tara:strand:+ start:136 stop:810 length:675 start_codon:yes stop_codon:yes gene_type:complete
MIKGIAEYVDINIDIDLYKDIFLRVLEIQKIDRHWSDDTTVNEFGKTQFQSFSLEGNYSGKPTEYARDFKPILNEQYKVHPYMQKRSTGFNYSNSAEKDLFIHTDIDLDTEHPKHFNLIIPIFGTAVISYYEMREDEVWLPEKNAHGYAYYHEFKKRNDSDYEEFKAKRKFGEIIADKPVLLDTNTMHGVEILECPRCAWCSRWNNIPEHYDFYSWKDRVESIL